MSRAIWMYVPSLGPVAIVKENPTSAYRITSSKSSTLFTLILVPLEFTLDRRVLNRLQGQLISPRGWQIPGVLATSTYERTFVALPSGSHLADNAPTAKTLR